MGDIRLRLITDLTNATQYRWADDYETSNNVIIACFFYHDHIFFSECSYYLCTGTFKKLYFYTQ
jgi:hypothetical protein